MKQLKILFNSLILLILANLFVVPAYGEINGTLLSPSGNPGFTSKGGQLFLGTHLWVSDIKTGFCRLDPDSTGVNIINMTTCVKGKTVGKVTSGPINPGQPALDAKTQFVYMPDKDAVDSSSGVWRLKFDPLTETITSCPVENPCKLLVDMSTLDSKKPIAVALDAAGNLYVGSSEKPDIAKITGPLTGDVLLPAQVNSSFGLANLTDKKDKGVSGLAIANGATAGSKALYIAEGKGGVSMINLPAGGNAVPVSSLDATIIPVSTAITSTMDGTKLFIANTPGGVGPSTIFRFTIASGQRDIFTANGALSTTATPIQNATGLSTDPAGNVYIGDDPTAGMLFMQGQIWKLPASSPANSFASLFSPSGKLGVTVPQGMVWLGDPGNLWISDGKYGFCRLDQVDGTFGINTASCHPKLLPMGQPTRVPNSNFIYVSDNSNSKNSAVYRVQFDPTTNAIVGNVSIINITAIQKLDPELSGPTATALDADGNLYVGFITGNKILKITDPGLDTQKENISWGNSSLLPSGTGPIPGPKHIVVAKGPNGTALYLAEPRAQGISRIYLDKGGKAELVGGNLSSMTFPFAMISNANDTINIEGADTLFIANALGETGPSSIYSYNTITDILTPASQFGVLPNGTNTNYLLVTGLGLHPTLADHLFIGDVGIWNTVLDTQAPEVTTSAISAKNGGIITLSVNVIDKTTDPFLSAVSGVKNVTVNAAPMNASLGTIVLNNVPGTTLWTNSSVTVFASDQTYLLDVTAMDNADIQSGGIRAPNANITAKVSVKVFSAPTVLVAVRPGRTTFTYTVDSTVYNAAITTTTISGNLTVSPEAVPPLVPGVMGNQIALKLTGLAVTESIRLEIPYDEILFIGNEIKLRLWNFNPATGTWSMTDSSNVDTVGNMVSGNTTSLSVFAPLAAVSLIQSGVAATNSGNISWTTNIPSTGIVKYSTNPSNLSLSAAGKANVSSDSVIISGLTAGIPVFFVVNSTDQTGNTALSALQSFTPLVPQLASGGVSPTPTPPPSGGGGSSGGGGGAGSGESYANIIAKETYDAEIFKDIVTSYKYKNASNPITHVNVTGNTNAGLITAMIEVLKGTSVLVKEAPPGVVYKNVNVWLGTVGYATPRNLKEVVVRFSVANSWMQSKNVDAKNIKLLRWDNTSKVWTTLETKVKEKDGSVTYFEGTTNALSPLAISAVATSPVGLQRPETATLMPGETPEKATPSMPKATPGFEIAMAIAAISALYVLGRKIRR